MKACFPLYASYDIWTFLLYQVGAILVFLLGVIFLFLAFQLLKTKQIGDAKKLMICSLIYLPVLQIIYIIDKYI